MGTWLTLAARLFDSVQDPRGGQLSKRHAILLTDGGSDDEGLTTRINPPGTGTVRLRRDVQKADEMALDTASTKTTRIRP